MENLLITWPAVTVKRYLYLISSGKIYMTRKKSKILLKRKISRKMNGPIVVNVDKG